MVSAVVTALKTDLVEVRDAIKLGVPGLEVMEEQLKLQIRDAILGPTVSILLLLLCLCLSPQIGSRHRAGRRPGVAPAGCRRDCRRAGRRPGVARAAGCQAGRAGRRRRAGRRAAWQGDILDGIGAVEEEAEARPWPDDDGELLHATHGKGSPRCAVRGRDEGAGQESDRPPVGEYRV